MFNEIYAVIVGIYLGDCVTTAIVISIGAKEDAKRVGTVNILYNLAKSAAVLIAVFILRKLGFLDNLWYRTVNSGVIANTNSLFNLVCAFVLFPLMPLFEKLSYKIVKSEPVEKNPYAAQLEELNPVFFSTPALALNSSYHALLTVFRAARANIETALGLFREYDEEKLNQINAEEENIDLLTDRVSGYLADMSAHLVDPLHIAIMNEYFKVATDFERLGDHAVSITEVAQNLHDNDISFSSYAMSELKVLHELMDRILDLSEKSFQYRDVEAAASIEPLEEVVDDLVEALKSNHLARLTRGECTLVAGTAFMNLLGELERISDLCSNIGLATVSRVYPDLAGNAHDYAALLHSGQDDRFNREYRAAHDEYFSKLEGHIPSPETTEA